jgi:hypothetical protein
MLRALVGGCFSFKNGHATAGDLLACELVCDWLLEAGMPFDVARVPSLGSGIDWTAAEPTSYSHVIYVCGPFERGGELETGFLLRFGRSRLIGVDLTMLTPLNDWNPFDALIERDSTRAVHPDITLASTRPRVPVVGVCLVEDYPGAAVAEANAAIARLMAASPVAVVNIDTRLDENGTGLRTASEIESVLGRMDAVVTTRLHGLVLSLKNGVPVVAIDPERGGAKVERQARALDWPAILTVEAASDSALQLALAYCLSDEGRRRAIECGRSGAARVEDLRRAFIAAVEAQETRVAPKVSVVIRDSGNQSWLGEAIRSVEAQSHPALEIIVVSDRAGPVSSLSTGSLRQVSLPGAGADAASGFNAGAAVSRGDLVLFMEASDRLLPHALSTGLNCFHLYPQSAFVYGRCRYMDADGRPSELHAQPLEADTYASALAGNPFEGPAILYRRSVLEASRFEAASSANAHYALCLRISAVQPAQGYDEVVVERTLHSGSSCLRAGPMLAASVRALSAEWPRVKHDRHRARLLVSGIRRARMTARLPLLRYMRANVSRGRFLTAAIELRHLVLYFPAWLGSLAFQLRARFAEDA